MQIFKRIFFYFTLICPAITLLWVNQDSFNIYWQQQFHQESPIQKYLSNSSFKYGQNIHQYIDSIFSRLVINNIILKDFNAQKSPAPIIDNISSTPSQEVIKNFELIKEMEDMEEIIEVDNTDNSNNVRSENTNISPETQDNIIKHKTPILLTSNDQVFFAGDSLMQGIAPHVQKILQKEYNIKSINLSKQSTGLVFPKLFNWPKTIEKTLNNNPKIKLLVIMLGANDTWDIQFSNNNHHLKYQSKEWEQEYKNRLDHILNTAKKHNVTILWLGIPYMKRNLLNKQMRYLENLLIEHLENKINFIPTKHLLNDPLNTKYQTDIIINNKPQRVRSKDGVHFTVLGQKILAEEILRHIKVENNKQNEK